MATRLQRIPQEEFDNEDSGSPCLSFLCFLSVQYKKSGETAERALLQGDCTRENCLKKRAEGVKELILETMRGMKCRGLVEKIYKGSKQGMIAKRKPVFRYDSTSYALNFDESSGLLNDRIAARTEHT